MASPKFIGRLTVVNFAIAKKDADPAGLTFKRLGAMRGKELDATWDEVDATTDDSPGNSKERLSTYLDIKFTCDGVSYGEDVANQKELKSQIYSPSVATDGQPDFWLQILDPDGDEWIGPFKAANFKDSRPYSDVAIWSTEFASNGAVAYTAAP